MEKIGTLLPTTLFKNIQKQNNISLGLCSICKNNAPVKDKICHQRKYYSICEICFNRINNKKSGDSFFKTRLSNRKNIVGAAENSGVPKRYLNCSFENFDGNTFNLESTNVFTKNSILIWGQRPGIGKTHLAVSLLKKFLWHGIEAFFVTAPKLLLELRASFNKDSDKDEEYIINEYSKFKMLVIDDIGSEKTSEYSLQAWYLIVDNRYANELPTIFTSNFSLQQLAEKIGDRLASRIGSGRLIKVEGKDRRIN